MIRIGKTIDNKIRVWRREKSIFFFSVKLDFHFSVCERDFDQEFSTKYFLNKRISSL